MSIAMACATLVKGPIGLLLPATTIVLHGVATRRLSWLRHPGLAAGAGLYLLLVLPWYVAAEVRNPGYLRYFFLEEHVARFLTTRFEREAPWYFYAGVLAAGVFPWTASLVALGSRVREDWKDDRTLFLYLWALVPVVAFSLSQSKLPGYVLPSLPPLAVLMGEDIARRFDAPRRARWPIAVASLALLLAVSAVAVVLVLPDTLSAGLLRGSVTNLLPAIRNIAWPAILVILGFLAVGAIAILRAGRKLSYVAMTVGLAAVYALAATIEAPVAESRSSRNLAQQVSAQLQAGDELVIYDDYFASLPFYLRIERPIWLVWLGRRGEVFGSPYVAEKRPRPALGQGVAWMTGAEFDDVWAHGSQRLLVLVSDEKLERFTREVGAAPRVLFSADGASLVVKP
jgi:4-amino-4-deoxy-L-arabinose transferase-like glycosyltransferase